MILSDEKQSSERTNSSFPGSRPAGELRSKKTQLMAFSVATNLLLLAMPIYLAQLYDRVLPSGNFDTLIYLSAFVLICLAIHGSLEAVRGKLAHDAGSLYELSSAPSILKSVVDLQQPRAVDPVKRMEDLTTIRQAFASRAFIGLFDLPFTPLFLILLFLVHPVIGAIGLFGVVLLITLAIANETLINSRMRDMSANQGDLDGLRDEFFGTGNIVRTMNIAEPLINRWLARALDQASRTRDINRVNANCFGFLRFFRQAIQLCILGGGAFLVIEGNLSAGLIFAASIIAGKALMPIEQLIGSWRLLASALNAHRRIQSHQKKRQVVAARTGKTTTLPTPEGYISCKGLTILASDQPDRKIVLSDITFQASPGEVIALIGSSGAGKSTLLEAIAGLHHPNRGKVYFDGFSIDEWDPETLGKHVGFANQQSAFLNGSISENIARFSEAAFDIATSKAATRAGMHGLIGTIENGYRQQIDHEGNPLSAGQKQWINLSRAFYGDPQILLLDEPDTGLDQVGEAMLKKAIARARERGKTVIFSTRRAQLAKCADTVLLIDRGRIVKQGEATTVLKPGTGIRGSVEPSKKIMQQV